MELTVQAIGDLITSLIYDDSNIEIFCFGCKQHSGYPTFKGEILMM